MARKAEAKVDDVDFKLSDVNGMVSDLKNHPSIKGNLKDSLKKQAEKAELELASSKSLDVFISLDITDFNCIGLEENDAGIFVKKDESGNLTDSDFEEYFLYLEEQKKLDDDNVSEQEKKNIRNRREKRQIDRRAKRQRNKDNRQENLQKMKKVSVTKYNTVVKSALGFYENTIEKWGDIRGERIENREKRKQLREKRSQGRQNRKEMRILVNQGKGIVYNGEGKKIGEKNIQYTNELGVPIVEDFYLPIWRMVNSAKDDNVEIVVKRAYKSFEQQLETRRLYAPENKKQDNEWLLRSNKEGFKMGENDIEIQPPGYGYHIFGTAFDLNATDMKVYSWLIKNAHNYGFYRTLENEIWHWEYKPWLYRVGGDGNMGKSKFGNENRFVGGWSNDIWEKLYSKLNDYKDPIGPKFIPIKHDSWLNMENLAVPLEIDNGNNMVFDNDLDLENNMGDFFDNIDEDQNIT